MTKYDRLQESSKRNIPVPMPEGFNERYSLFYNNELKALDDDTYFLERFNASSRLLRKHPELRETLELALICEDDDSLVEAGDAICDAVNEMPRIRALSSRTLDYLSFSSDVSQIKTDTVGHEASAARLNYLIFRRAEQYIQDMNIDESEGQTFVNHYIKQRLEQLFEKGSIPPNTYSYMSAKLQTLSSQSNMLEINRRFFDLLVDGEDSRTYTKEEIDEHTRDTSELFDAIRKTHTHGLKLGYFTHHDGGSLIYGAVQSKQNSEYVNKPLGENLHPLTAEKTMTSVFDVVYSGYHTPRYVEPERMKIHDKTGNMVSSGFSIDNLRVLMTGFVGHDGELYTGDSCVRPLAYDAAALGKYEQYRSLQATIFAQYCDLTRTVGESTPNNSRLPATYTSPNMVARDPLDVFNELVVPRLRKAESTTPSDNNDSSKIVRLHNVAYFVRQLPDGAHASPQAQQLAYEHGIELPEGMTFVRAHKRGSEELGRVVAHKLIQRGAVS